MVLITEIGLRWNDGDIIRYAGICEDCETFQVYGGYRDFCDYCV
jgi:hypothetical protein